MGITTTVHLNFRDRALQALEFYRSVFGGRLVAFTYGQAQDVEHPADTDRILWGEVRADNGFHVMAYDVRENQTYDAGDRPFFVSVRGEDAEEITGYWKALSEGATIIADLGPSGWAPLYGMLEDRFGVTWTLDIATPYAG
ncbi:VOC family protein [Streptomyces minutiscleroticus]|uniref:VOC family protein n=1 Tax=Streptomyces minutiscleroticus TaxID=68238 RepID=A0A918NV26_9ACTN|nr:VOC family protein [Streptomyces minutiscleroticus]GGX97043.1 VOC family protein [Streptomyces minutiscleroticus]